jgi:hypothetical protein
MASPIQRNTWDNVVIVTRDGTTDQTWDGRVKNLVYNVDSMAWEAATGGSTGGVSSEVAVTNFPASQAVTSSAATAATSNVSASTSATSVLAVNASRKGAHFYNDSSADCYLKFGSGASSTSFTLKMAAYSYAAMELPIYTGAITAAWASATGALRVTELT